MQAHKTTIGLKIDSPKDYSGAWIAAIFGSAAIILITLWATGIFGILSALPLSDRLAIIIGTVFSLGVLVSQVHGRHFLMIYVQFLILGAVLGLVLISFPLLVVLWFLGLILLLTIIFKVAFLTTMSYMNYRKDVVQPVLKPDFNPRVSIISPCYNEGLTLENAMASLIDQSYENYEIIIVDDGSKDNTKEVGTALATKYQNKIRFFSKPNGGKATALNYGIAHATGEIVICMDADTVFMKDTVRNMVAAFQDEKVIAASGNVKVSNRGKFLTNSQSLEYISGIQLQGRALAQLRSMQVITGALGAFRKWAITEVGGYSTDTIVEDQDLTVTLQERFSPQGYKIVFNNSALAYTEAPETWQDFAKQRYRWTYGWYQVIKKHKRTILNPKHRIGMVGIPYTILNAVTNILMLVFFLSILTLTLINGQYYGFLIAFIYGSALVIFMSIYAMWVDRYNEKRHVSLLAIVQTVWYLIVLDYIYIKAGYNHAVGKEATWGKATRLGKNVRFGKSVA